MNCCGLQFHTQSQYNLSPELLVSEFLSGISVSQVKNVCIDDHHLQDPKENFTPPTHRLAVKLVVGHSLVQMVHFQHVLVVLVNYQWFHLWCRPRISVCEIHTCAVGQIYMCMCSTSFSPAFDACVNDKVTR
jgi:hypothetical protein